MSKFKFILRRINEKILFRKVKPEGSLDMFFILSAGRSGSTLLRKHLTNHTDIHIPPESEDNFIKFLNFYFNNKNEDFTIKYINYLISSNWFQYWNLDIETIRKRIKDSLSNKSSVDFLANTIYDLHLEKFKPNAKLIGDKTPYLNYYIEGIHRLYPKGKLIYIVRDPRAVISSYKDSLGYSTEDAIKRWKVSVKAYLKYKKWYKSRIIEIRYEDFVNAPTAEMGRICEFLSIEYTENLLNVAQPGNLGDTHLKHHQNIKNEINTKSLEKWKTNLTKDEIMKIEGALESEMKLFKYERVS